MTIKVACQLVFLLSVSTLLAAVTDLGHARTVWVPSTVISHVVLISLASRILRKHHTD